MRTIYIYILFIIVIFTSCQKGVLDKKPLDIITEDMVWADPALMDAYLTEAYAQTSVWESESVLQPYMGSGDKHYYIFLIHSITDECKTNSGWAGSAHGTKMNGIRIGGGFLEWWERPYKIIRNLNLFISKVPSSPLDENLKTQRVAEARFIRAFNYFEMAIRYGGVPLITKVQNISDPEEELFPARNSEKEIYDFIIAEMDAIKNDLQETVPDADYGRPGKYAAIALKSRAALYAGSIAKYGTLQLNGLLGFPASDADVYFQKSLDASKEIMDSHKFDLYNKYPDDKVKNFRNIFLDERNIETIFARVHNDQNRDAGGNGWQYDFFNCPRPGAWGQGNTIGPYLEMVKEFDNIDGSPDTRTNADFQTGLWTMEQLWGNKDPRFAASIYTNEMPWQGRILNFRNGILTPDGSVVNTTYNGVINRGENGGFGGFGILKYLDESKSNMDAGTGYSSSTDWILFRYAETLLNYAEASFELNHAGDALTVINQIRARAGITGTLGSITMDQIRHERKVELAFEAHRYWDLRRWRIAKNVLTVNRSGLRYILDYNSYDPNSNTHKYKLQVFTNYDNGNSNPVFFDYNYYFPITLARTQANTNLKENPGYE
ncbi:MAG: RagB/SusD family nutrient uptake outer membrane protein [Niabella sp.]